LGLLDADRAVEITGHPFQQLGHLDREAFDRRARGAVLDGWRQDQGEHEAGGGAYQGLCDATGGRSLRAADAEHEHGANGHFEQVRAQTHEQTQQDRGGNHGAEAPHRERDELGQGNGQRDPEHDGQDPADAVGDGAEQRDLDDQQRRQGRRQRPRVGQGRRGHRVAQRRRSGEPDGADEC
jgi:hypothetical protein